MKQLFSILCVIFCMTACRSGAVNPETSNAASNPPQNAPLAMNDASSTYDAWPAWVGCYFNENAALNINIQPLSSNLTIKNIQESGNIKISIADASGNAIVDSHQMADAVYKLNNNHQLISTLKFDSYTGCISISSIVPDESRLSNVHLYGEIHSVDDILQKELDEWRMYYHQGMRHLFVEFPHYWAEYLNRWMKEDGDQTLIGLFDSVKGTAVDSEQTRNFFRRIKSDFPETIFHGTDVGHAYQTMGMQYKNFLESNNLAQTQDYKLTLESIWQGSRYYSLRATDKSLGARFRENLMANNFIREFETNGQNGIMGIYGNTHLIFGRTAWETTGSNMITMLAWFYGTNKIHSEDLALWHHRMKANDRPYTDQTADIRHKTYKVRYYGEQSMKGALGYDKVEFRLVEDAYEDFKNDRLTGDNLPELNYIMPLEKGQVYILEYTKTDGSKQLKYFRNDGIKGSNGAWITQEFSIDRKDP